MSQGIISVTLFRDGPQTAWGFRLQGGRDLGFPLTIQRVFLGSPSEGELHRGDIIMRIGNKEAAKLSHQEAHNIIKAAGNNISLVVARGGQFHPHSPDVHGTTRPMIGLPPVSAVAAASSVAAAAATRPAGGSPYLKPLPTTHFPTKPYQLPSNAPAAQDDRFEGEREKIAINNQPHRTFPLITPGVKVKHDVPVGSYLRFVNDPYAKMLPTSTGRPHPILNQVNETLMKAKITETVTNAASNPSTPIRGRSETPDSSALSMVVNRQYNTPINLYSAQNVAATIQGQTGLTPVASLPTKSFSLTKSPTYQTIYEQEWKELRKDELQEHKPVEQKMKVLPPPQEGVDMFGNQRNRIIQSKTFELLEDSLRGETSF